MTDKLRAALEPFARLADAYDPPEGDDADTCFGSAVPLLGDLRRARAALAAAPQPAPEQGDMPARIWAWKEDCGDVWTGEWSPERDADHVPNEATEYRLVEAAPQPAPEREALVEVIQEVRRRFLALYAIGATTGTLDGYTADALLARGLRLPAPETMAWAVVGDDGRVLADTIRWERGDLDRAFIYLGKPVRVAIRVVEGGDDAA